MLSYEKRAEVASQIHELLQTSEDSIIEMLKKASESGAITEGMRELQSYLLAKFLVTIYFDERPYAPFNRVHKADMKNLALFV